MEAMPTGPRHPLPPPPPKPRRAKGTGSVYREGDRWRGEVTVDGRTRKVSATSEAIAWARLEALKRGEDPIDAVPSAETVATWLPRYIATHPKLKDRTRITYGILADRHIIPALGKRRLSDLTTPMVADWLADMAAHGYSNIHCANCRNVLSGSLQAARVVAGTGVVTNVARGIKVGDAGNGFLVEDFDEGMARRVLDALRPSPHYDFYALLLYTLCRRGELLGLDWAQVHKARREIVIRQTASVRLAPAGSGARSTFGYDSPKSRKSRIVPLPDEAMRLISPRFRAAGEPERGLVFPSVHNPERPMDPGTLKVEFDRRLKAAGLPPMRFHDLRHAGASILLARGVPIAVVSKMLGHANTGITARLYAHALDQSDREAAEKLRFFPEHPRGWSHRRENRRKPGASGEAHPAPSDPGDAQGGGG